MRKSTEGGCERSTSRSSYRIVKSFLERYSKLRTLVIRTWSPSMATRGITATSRRQLRSWVGRRERNQSRTMKANPAYTKYRRGLRATQKIQTLNSIRTNDSTSLIQNHGSLE